MKRSLWLVVLCFTMVGADLAAQQAPRPAAPAAPAAPAPPAPPQPAVAVTVPDASVGGQPVNIRVDLAITEQAGPAPVLLKTLTLLSADRFLTSIRSSFEDRTLNVDVRPTIENSRIRLLLSVAINPQPGASLQQVRQSQTLTMFLENGKSTVVMESTDPASNNRKLSVEVKATILK